MGLFSKKKNTDEYISYEELESDDNRYAEWSEQARQVRNPEALTPEQLLGILDTNVQEEDEILKSADIYEGKTAKTLYEKMMENLNSENKENSSKDDELSLEFETQKIANIEQEEEVIEDSQAEEPYMESEQLSFDVFEENNNEQEISISIKDSYNPENDQLADFFKSLEGAEKVEEIKTVQYQESDEKYAESVIESEQYNQKASNSRTVEELLNLIYNKSHTDALNDCTEEQEIVADEGKTITKESDIKEENLTQDTMVFDNLDDTVTEDEKEIEKTKFIDLPDATIPIPKHSLYSNNYSIDRKAIDDFFNNTESNSSDTPPKIKYSDKEETYIEEDNQENFSYQDVFNDDIEDYEHLDDAAKIKKELLTRRRRLSARLLSTIILTLLMAVINSGFFAFRSIDLGLIPNICNLALLVIAIAINYRSFIGLFRRDIDTDAVTTVVSLVVLVQSIVSLVAFEGQGGGLGVLSGLAYSISLIAKRAVCSATLKSINVIATNETKHAVNMIEDSHESAAVCGGAIEGEPCVCYSKKTVNVKGMLKNWYHKTPDDDAVVTSLVLSSIFAVLFGVLFYLLISTEISSVLSVFVITFSIISAPTMYLSCSLPVKIMTDSLKHYGATVAGWNGATALSECNVVHTKAQDLFPAGGVVLHKMNPLSPNKIDESIAKAAALAIKAESPLANIFKDIIRDELGNLPAIDDFKYESQLGLSGWIGNECILLGNRTLMENHNIKTPSIDSEKMILSAGYKPVYLAVGGRPCLLFVVQYSADPNVEFELSRLCSAGTTVIVDSSDPNITKHMIYDLFDLDEDDVEMMTRGGKKRLSEYNTPQESANGFAAYKDKSSGFLAALSCSIRLMTIRSIMRVLHIIGIILTVGIFAFMLYSTGALMPNAALLIAAFQIVFVCITSAIPYIKRP